MAQVGAAHATLARNLLSSVLALAFPDNLVSDATAQRGFLTQLPQLRALLTQHNVFDFVTDGKALDKFQTRLFELIDTPTGVDRDLKATAFELLLVMVEQCPLEVLEVVFSKLSERILKMVKYLKDAPRVIAAASDVARVLVHHIEGYAPEVRRDAHDWLAKLLPANAAVLADLVAKDEELSEDDVALFRSVVGVFVELLDVAPSAVRATQNKLEAAVAALALYNPAIARNADAVSIAAQCLATVSNASDKSHAVWKQIVDKALEMGHQLVDPIAGKRVATAALPTGMKVWLRENGGSSGASDLEARAVYERIQLLLERLTVVVSVLEESMQNRAVSEREVQLVIADVVALTRRIVTIRAHEIGKQSAISDDGFRLPLSVVYGALPQLHALGLRCLNAVVTRAGLCALRHASKIAKVLVLASENVHGETHAALYETVGVCVRVLGASTLERIGQPLLEHVVAQCKQDLLDDDKSKKSDADDAKPTTNGKSGKGKKRKRQIGDLAQLSGDAAGASVSFLSTRNQRVLVDNVDAALAAIATCVAVYGSLLPTDTRSLASDVALLAVQQQVKRRTPAAPRHGLDSIAMLLLTDAVTADANSAHATNVVKSVDYWSSSSTVTLLPLVALSASEALVHPRAPPLSLNFDSAIQQLTAPKAATSNSVFGLSTRSGPMAPGSAAVRGRMDWDREEQEDQEDEEPQPESVTETSAKRAKTEEPEDEDDVTMAETRVPETEKQEQAEEDEVEEEEEDFEDERPAVVEANDEKAEVSVSVPAKVTANDNDNDDDDDDEFPDIVVDDDDDDE